MNEFTVAMALVDYVPVLLFAAAAVILQEVRFSTLYKIRNQMYCQS